MIFRVVGLTKNGALTPVDGAILHRGRLIGKGLKGSHKGVRSTFDL